MKSRIGNVASYALLLCLLALHPAPALASGSSVYLEDLTWMEIRDRIQTSSQIAIIPIGGTEQNGPQMVTGSHNMIVRYTAGAIARKLGNAMVAPVIAYAPVGRIEPPEGNMLFAGTLSVSEQTFAALLEDAASSLKAHGFRLICFIGDSSGSQYAQQQVADRLSSRWREEGVRVLQVSDYYAHNGQIKWTGTLGIKSQNPGVHAGMIETSELMAVDPLAVRQGLRGVRSERDYRATGAMGDSTLASAAYGKRFLGLKVNAAVKQIQDAAFGSK
jgi:creatinine amidohydrolase